MKTRIAAIAIAVVLLAAELAIGQQETTIISSDVRMSDGSSLQAWADDQVGSTSHPVYITPVTTDMNQHVEAGFYVSDFAYAVNRPPGSEGDGLLVINNIGRRSQVLIGKGWGKVWTRGTTLLCHDPCTSPSWSSWVEHDLGFDADDVRDLIATQLGQQSGDVVDVILEELLARTGDNDGFNVTGAAGPTAAAEPLGSRLEADDDEWIRIDVQRQNSTTGAVVESYDPIFVARADILALIDADTNKLLNLTSKYRSYPLTVDGVPATSGQTVRLGRHGNELLLAFGTAQTSTPYRVSASGLDLRIDGQAVGRALQGLATGSVDGHALKDVPVSYGSTTPAVARSTPGELFIEESGSEGELLWLRPAASAATTNRNRVQVVAQSSGGVAYAGWQDATYDPSKTPDNYNRFLGGLQRIHVPKGTNDNRYLYSVYLRSDMLSGLGIDAQRDGAIKFSLGVSRQMVAMRRYGPTASLGPSLDLTSTDGIRYLQFTSAVGSSTVRPNFVQGTTYSLLFWKASDNTAAINFKPATTRSPAAWESPVPAPVSIGDSLPSVTGRRNGELFLLRAGTVASRTWTLYVLTPDAAGNPGSWQRPS